MRTLGDPKLWGNEAADDEDPDVLNSYFVEQDNFSEFLDASTRFSVVRARKGMGKSALLREAAYRLEKAPQNIVISLKGADLVAQRPVSKLSPDEHIYDWEQRICMSINRRIGASIGLALSDDAISLVETAELSGFKSRNLVGSLADRMKGKLDKIELTKLGTADHRELLKRYCTDHSLVVWVFVDDIDATFRRFDDEVLRLSTFFSACRDLCSSFKGINIRTCVRSDVWTSIRKSDESLDKCEQYIFDINWSQRQTGVILAGRVRSFLKRNRLRHPHGSENDDVVLELVFPRNYPWGRGPAWPYRVIHVYSGGRPRWAAQLCRMAGKEADKTKSTRIQFGHIQQVLEQYGRFRLDDIAREHRHQCVVLNTITNAFARRSARFDTNTLLKFVQENIIPHIKIEIDGVSTSSSIEVCAFLFRIGFLLAFSPKDFDATNRYFAYDEKPELLKNISNLDDGHHWIVHPSYHAALGLYL